MTVITEDGGRTNMFASEPSMSYVDNYDGYGPNAEKLNGRLAMLGFVAGIISYASTGSFFFFGILGFWLEIHNDTQLTHYRYTTMTPEAEKFNGWAAMLGFVAAVGAYATTGQIIPGIF